jgi:hypothetical protein
LSSYWQRTNGRGRGRHGGARIFFWKDASELWHDRTVSVANFRLSVQRWRQPQPRHPRARAGSFRVEIISPHTRRLGRNLNPALRLSVTPTLAPGHAWLQLATDTNIAALAATLLSPALRLTAPVPRSNAIPLATPSSSPDPSLLTARALGPDPRDLAGI